MPSSLPPPTVTLHDVARAAGVSPITASRALANPHLVSKATLARVHDAVEATGYIPNRVASGLKSRRSMTVGALLPRIAAPQFLPTVQALADELGRAGYQLVIGQTGDDPEREAALVDAFVGRRVDGIVAAGLLRSSAAAQRLRELGLPTVETWDLGEHPCDLQVGFSHLAVGSAVAGYFRGKGWSEVALVSGDGERATRRRDGFVATLGRDVPTAFVPAPGGLALGRAALAELLARPEPLRAVFCSSDELAHGVLTEARARRLRVPEDLAVVGFGGADYAAATEPALTTVRIDGAAIGRLAAAQLLARCRGEAIAKPAVDVGFEIVERASSAGR